MTQAAATVLIVDDEPSLLKMISVYLERRGHRVVTFASTEKAWQHVEADPAAVALAVVDVSMAGLSAREFGARLLAANPRAQVIFSSGYPADLREIESAGGERISFLAKPFTPEMLDERVRMVLG